MGQLNIREVDDKLLRKLKVYAAEEGKTQKEVVESWLSTLRIDFAPVRLSGVSEAFKENPMRMPEQHTPKLADAVLGKVKGVKRASELAPRNPKPANDEFEVSARDREVIYEQD